MLVILKYFECMIVFSFSDWLSVLTTSTVHLSKVDGLLNVSTMVRISKGMNDWECLKGVDMELLFLWLHQLLEVCTFSSHGFKFYHWFCVCRQFALWTMLIRMFMLCRIRTVALRWYATCLQPFVQKRGSKRAACHLLSSWPTSGEISEWWGTGLVCNPECEAEGEYPWVKTPPLDLTRVCVGGIVVRRLM